MVKEEILQAFEIFQKQTRSKDPSWVQSLRTSAISRFAQLGFPTLRDEEWKYTSVEPIVKNSFRFAFESSPNGAAIQKIKPFLFGRPDWNRMVFVNGLYSKELSFLSKEARSAKITSLREALCSEPDTLEECLVRRQSDLEKNAFSALNTAFLHDGAFIDLPPGAALEEPIHLLFLSLAGEEKIISQPRNLVVAEEGSRAALIESYVSLAPGPYFTNGVSEILLHSGARIDYCQIQRESESAFHVMTSEVSVGREASFSSSVFSFGARLSRNNLNVLLGAEGCECLLNGFYAVTGARHVDHHTLIDHAKPGGKSRQLYKGILRDKGRAVFNGKILVRQDAQKTDAHQTNKNLLLSEGASVDTKPQLEIFADDVKCTHGAAVGQLEEEVLFYLKTRGIPEENARGLLTHAFASEVIQGLKLEPVRGEIDRLLWKILRTPIRQP